MSLRSAATWWLCRSVVGVVTLGLLISPLGLGFFMSRLNFTYGARGLDPSVRGRVVLEVALWIAAGVVFDAVLRRGLLERLRARLYTFSAVAVQLLVLNLLIAPAVFWFGVRTDGLSSVQVLLYENLLQILFSIVYLCSGSSLLSGLIQGSFAALRFTVINDVSGPFETLFFYSYSDAALGWVLALSPLLASSLSWVVCWALGSSLGPGAPETLARRADRE